MRVHIGAPDRAGNATPRSPGRQPMPPLPARHPGARRAFPAEAGPAAGVMKSCFVMRRPWPPSRCVTKCHDLHADNACPPARLGMRAVAPPTPSFACGKGPLPTSPANLPYAHLVSVCNRRTRQPGCADLRDCLRRPGRPQGEPGPRCNGAPAARGPGSGSGATNGACSPGPPEMREPGSPASGR